MGRGFSLVAAEMRRLAENVIESTKEIEGLIEEIREATHAAVTATEARREHHGRGHLAGGAGGRVASSRSWSWRGQTSDAVRSISLATQQQQTGTDQLAEAMADILRITQQSLERHQAGDHRQRETLLVLALDLRNVVERFQIGQHSAEE